MALLRGSWFVLALVSLPAVAWAQVEDAGAYRAGFWFGRILAVVLIVLCIRWLIGRLRK